MTRQRAARLAALTDELRDLIREATQAPDHTPLFHHTRTQEAQTAARTVTLSLREAADLYRAAAPTGPADATSRQRHAVLIVTLRYCLDTIRGLAGDAGTPAAVAAAKLAGRELRTWLRSIERPAHSKAKPTPAAQTNLLLPLNGMSLLRQESPPLHNSDTLRSNTAEPTPRKKAG